MSSCRNESLQELVPGGFNNNHEDYDAHIYEEEHSGALEQVNVRTTFVLDSFKVVQT